MADPEGHVNFGLWLCILYERRNNQSLKFMLSNVKYLLGWLGGKGLERQ